MTCSLICGNEHPGFSFTRLIQHSPTLWIAITFDSCPRYSWNIPQAYVSSHSAFSSVLDGWAWVQVRHCRKVVIYCSVIARDGTLCRGCVCWRSNLVKWEPLPWLPHAVKHNRLSKQTLRIFYLISSGYVACRGECDVTRVMILGLTTLKWLWVFV